MTFLSLDGVGSSPVAITPDNDVGRYCYYVTEERTSGVGTRIYGVKRDMGTGEIVWNTLIGEHASFITIYQYDNPLPHTEDHIYFPVTTGNGSLLGRVVKVSKSSGVISSQTTIYSGNINGMALDQTNNKLFVMVSGAPNTLMIHDANNLATAPTSVAITGENSIRELFYISHDNKLLLTKVSGSDYSLMRYSALGVFEATTTLTGASSSAHSVQKGNSNSLSVFGYSGGVTAVGPVSVVGLSANLYAISGNPPVTSIDVIEPAGSPIYIANAGVYGFNTNAATTVTGLGTTITSGTRCTMVGGRAYTFVDGVFKSFAIGSPSFNIQNHYTIGKKTFPVISYT